jgi:hypothetical protein
MAIDNMSHGVSTTRGSGWVIGSKARSTTDGRGYFISALQAWGLPALPQPPRASLFSS